VLTPDQLELAREVGDEPRAAGTTRVTARVAPDVRARVGEPIRLAFDAAHVHVFDPDTSLALR
jgi:ABC-type sugar transport system ATPase subunit